MAPPTPPTPPTRDRDRDPSPHSSRLRRVIPATGAVPPPATGDRRAVVPAAAGEQRPAAAAEHARSLPRSETPFAWQDGRRLLLLDEEPGGWTFAELRFDDVRCHYVEVRRATYRWPREAAGAILARGLGFGPEAVERLAVALDRWLAAHLALTGREDRTGA